MKKILLLGGSRFLLPVIEAAHNMGHYVITCDYLPDNIAHKYSDEYHNVSIVDKEAVLELAKRLKINGIMSFACDPGVVTAAYVAEKMGLPGAGPYESVCILQNKAKFRDFLEKNGFNVPRAKGYTEVDEALKDIGLFRWPVMVKPVDSAGSKGVTKVQTPEELKQSVEYALSFSRSKEFIIEEFLEKVGHSSDTDCFSVDGELVFVSFSAQRFDNNAINPYTPASYSWPGTISSKHQEGLKGEIQRAFNLLRMKSSIYNIETRECNDGEAYIMEMSPRGGGNRLAEMLRYSTGVDLIENAVRVALGEPVRELEQKEYDGSWAIIIIHSDQKGIFDSLWISDDIIDYVVEKDLWIAKGARVNGFSGANEAIGTLVLKFENEEMLEKVMSEQEKYIKVVLR